MLVEGADVQAQRGFAVEKGRRALHVAADAQGRRSNRGDRFARPNGEECVWKRGHSVRMGKQRVSSRWLRVRVRVSWSGSANGKRSKQ